MGRVEILVGRERRRRWSDEQKLLILEEVVTSGLPVTQIARRHDVLPQQIYGWRRQFANPVDVDDGIETCEAPAFLPVTVVAPEPEASTSPKPKPSATRRGSRIEIRCKGGRVLKVDAELAPEALRALIRSVEEA